MRNNKQTIRALIGLAAFLLLICDNDTAKIGVAEGIGLCINVIIPSLFPFFIVSSYMNQALLGQQVPGLCALGRVLHIPSGGESLLLLGLIGGYPVGAQMIGDAYKSGRLSKKHGQILLGYCNNAGPAFIFGVTATLFSSPWIPFLLWSMHIASAILTGFLLPRPRTCSIALEDNVNITLVDALRKSISVSASVCGWIILFKVILAYCSKFLTHYFSNIAFLCLTGILELSNGCISLSQIGSESLRFILCAIFLAFGGICVMLQTVSVTGDLGLRYYIAGKIMQSAISLLASVILSSFLFPDTGTSLSFLVLCVCICILAIITLKVFAKKTCGNFSESNV